MKLLRQDNAKIQFQSRNTLDFPQHIHDVLEVVFLHRGSATAVCGNRRYDLRAGDVFLSFPNLPHGYEDSQNVLCDVLIIPSGVLHAWRSQLSQKFPAEPVLPRGSWETSGVPVLLDMIRPERQRMAEGIKQGYAMVIAGKLLSVLPLSDRDPETGDTLRRLLEYLADHYREPLTRKELAEAVGYNESYISHVFAARLGTTLKAYITSLRLRDARELLTETDMSISQISMELGFGSIRSFNRVFAQEEGISPSAYRIDNRHKNL